MDDRTVVKVDVTEAASGAVEALHQGEDTVLTGAQPAALVTVAAHPAQEVQDVAPSGRMKPLQRPLL